tara:strand:- start:649 stop:1398 length:750 start_codon:yes stop_codon:yes gene_type:complete
MEEFFRYIEVNEWLIPLAVFLSLSFCLFLETYIPLFAHKYFKFRHLCVNSLFLITMVCVLAPLIALHSAVFIWQAEAQMGLFYLIDLPGWAKLMFGILILDLIGQYGVHYLLHRVKWMWRLHMIHHSDTHVEAKTGFRHHLGDVVFRNLATLFAVSLFGIPLACYLVYQLITIFFAYLAHSNIQLPAWLDKKLSNVIITPNLHKFHHHHERPWTDSNYGNILAVWDRLFGTLSGSGGCRKYSLRCRRVA